MNLKKFILFRKKLNEVEKTSFGFQGLFSVKNDSDAELISEFEDSEIRELFYSKNNNTATQKTLEIGDEVKISIDLSKFPNFYESFNEFIASNKYSLKHNEFYIFDLDYLHKTSSSNNKVNNFLQLQNIISFLKALSKYDKITKGLLELFFHKPDKICSIVIEYSLEDIENLNIKKSTTKLKAHVFEKSDQETRKKLFSNEMINLLSPKSFDFTTILNNWDNISNSYYSSYEIYLSEFSFEKIKTSSQEYFHELTDRIYSTINKFSTYILAIPVAYIFILRFFDFKGENVAKDSFLLIIGILYFIVIWFVLLNNLSKAFETIENDIDKFIKRIKDEENLNQITDSLKNQKRKIIPNQKKKICLVRIISALILCIILGAYLYIHL